VRDVCAGQDPQHFLGAGRPVVEVRRDRQRVVGPH
jgi:hypothetical protein